MTTSSKLNELNGKTVLVTGAGGFIASHLIEELVSLGARVRAFVHYNSRNDWGNLELLPKETLQQIEVIMGDVTDPFSIDAAVNGSDYVFHLAALIAIPFSYVAPQMYVNVNVMGTLNVAQACRRYQVTRLVHTSTSETYGTAIRVPIDEEHPLQGQSPYSASKIGADKMAESFWRSFALPVVTVRPFNCFGPRQSARAIIPTIISQCLSGDIVKVGSLDPVRDLTFVKDTVRGFVLAAVTEGVLGEVINLGNGKGITIGDLAGKLIELANPKAQLVHEEQRVRPNASEVFKLICDNSKAKRLLNWAPSVSLQDGLLQSIDYIRQNLAMYKLDMYVI